MSGERRGRGGPPVDEYEPHYETSAPRVAGWNDPGNTTGWADIE